MNDAAHVETSLSTETKRSIASDLIKKIAPGLDKKNVKGIMGFGSFWTGDGKRSPRDIDLAIYCDNDAMFDDEKIKLTEPLVNQFHIPVEIHALTPFTPMVKHQMKDYQEYLQDGTLLWGQMPDWLKK